MAPFQYEPFSSRPYVGQMADLLERQGEAQARGAAQSGQAWAGALRDIGQLPERLAQMREAGALADQRAMQTAQMQRAARGQQVLSYLIQQHRQTDPESGATRIDHEAVANDLSAAGFPEAAGNWLKLSADNAESLEKLRTSQQARRQAVLTAVGGAAAKASDPQDFLSRIGLLYHDGDGAIDADMMKTIAQNVQQAGMEGWPQVKARYVDFANQYGKKTVTQRPGASITNEATGETTTPVPVVEKPTEASLAAAAAAGDAGAHKALDLMRAQKNPPSMEEQYLTAVSKGDQGTANSILATWKAKANASKDPGQIGLANEMAQLRKQEADERLKKLREENAPVDVSSSTFTTQSGRQYVDLSEFQTPGAKEKARKAAMDAGVMPVNKEVADGLRAADTARANFQALWAQLSPFLATDPSGRLATGPANKLEKLFQTNPTLGAFGSWRTAAIQAVQALAEKGMGLRLNRNEIDLMLQNDIPQITDDAPTAKQRIDNMMTLLDNKEKDALERDRSQFAPKPPQAPEVTLTPGLKRLSERR